MSMTVIALAALLTLVERPRTLAARGTWAALDRGSQCEALSRALLPQALDRPAALITVTFDRAGRRSGELSIRFRRPLRPGSSVILTVGDMPFELAAAGQSAWSRGPVQEAAILEAIRASGGARATARDGGGRRMTERFLLDGAPTAIDAAAAACARPMSRP
ncbi:MAG TPA: hypothetical protein VFO42_07750 [Sphingomicrobium sp.]|nr:hypothetical protein [Sphingomicrobium sp.]